MEQVYKHKVTVFDETLSVSSTVGKKIKDYFLGLIQELKKRLFRFIS